MKIKSTIMLAIFFTFFASVMSGCGSNNSSAADTEAAAQSAVSGASEETSEEASTEETKGSAAAIEYSDVPENIYLSEGQTEIYYVKNGMEFNSSETDSNIAAINTIDVRSGSSCDTDSYVSDAEDGHYYAIYSRYLGTFISSEQSESGIGMQLTATFDPVTCVWKAEEKENGIYFANTSGYLQYDSDILLTCGETGSPFSFIKSDLSDYPGSLGFIISAESGNFRLDCPSASQVNTYADDGVVYPHTAFYLCEITDGTIDYTKVQITGNACGDTTAASEESAYYIHVYDPDNMQITFHEAGQTLTASGYELPDNEVHDCGFYTYQCDPDNNLITFTSVSEGKETVQIGHFSYNIIFGGTECSYNTQEFSSFFEAVSAASETGENPRLSNKTISLLNDDILYNGTLPAGVLIDFNGYYGSDGNNVMMTYTVPNSGEEKSTEVCIYPVINGDTQYLYLPSFADFSGLQLNLPDGAVISSENAAGTITTSGFNAPVDLTEIFGDMGTAGAEFPITVTWESGNIKVVQNVILMKSANTDSAFFELEEDGITDMPEWLNSSKSNKPDKAKAVILSSDGSITYDGKIKTFHVRGNTNVGEEGTKVGYGFKLKERVALAGDVESRAWILVANSGSDSARDTSTYGTAFGSTLYQRLNSDQDGDYAVQYKPVDIYINGEYRGMYILTDKVNDTRFDMNVNEYADEEDENLITVSDAADPAIAAGIQEYSYDANAVVENKGGFIIEICGSASDTYGFISRRGVPIEIKIPETPTKEQVQSIAMYYQQFEDALYAEDGASGKLSDYADLESIAKVYLVKAFLKDMDFFWASTYFYIDADASGFTTKLKGCTAWDFDGCHTIYPGSTEELFDTSLGNEYSACDYKWQLLKHDEFVEELTRLNNEKVFENGTMSFMDIVSDMTTDGSFIDEYYEQVNNAMRMNKSLWPYCEWNDSITDTMKKRINDRLSVWETLIPASGKISGIPE